MGQYQVFELSFAFLKPFYEKQISFFMALGLILERFPVMAQQADVCLQLSETKFAGPKKK
jgi:hypothetical protein